jgi:hypothetical protein
MTRNIAEIEINDYQAFTVTVAMYPAQVEREYLALGLCSEAAEIAQIGLEPFDNDADIPKKVEEIVKELGDCTWYTARLAAHYQWPFYNLCNAAFRGAGAQIDLEGGDFGDAALQLCMGAGVAAGVIKKQLRDGHTWSGEKRQEQADKLKMALIDHLQAVMVLLYVIQKASDEELSFRHVLEVNRAKLTSRQARGTLSGDGGNR